MLDIQALLYVITGFFWGGLTAPVAIRLADTYGIIDIPNARKIHTHNIPRGAGLGLWLGYMLMSVLRADMPYIATGATLIFLCGYLDDMCSLSPFLRLALHVMAACLAVVPLDADIVTTSLAVIWIAGVTSAYNLIDGMNGLCISLFIASSAALYFMWGTYAALYAASMSLGILCWNFPSAQTFLGDGGSTLLGYIFASQFVAHVPHMRPDYYVIALMLFGGVPVLDTLTAFVRRIVSGKSPFYPDRKHMHHVLIGLTGSEALTVSVMLGLHVMLIAWGVRWLR